MQGEHGKLNLILVLLLATRLLAEGNFRVYIRDYLQSMGCLNSFVCAGSQVFGFLMMLLQIGKKGSSHVCLAQNHFYP